MSNPVIQVHDSLQGKGKGSCSGKSCPHHWNQDSYSLEFLNDFDFPWPYPWAFQIFRDLFHDVVLNV